MTNPQTTDEVRAEAKAAVLERNPKSVERREKKTSLIARVEQEKIRTENQIRICQESLVRKEQDLKEKRAQVAEIDRLIEEAVEYRILAEELRPEYQAAVAQGRSTDPDDVEFGLMKKRMIHLDKMVNSLDAETAKTFFNHGGRA